MALRAIRGAATVEKNTKECITAATIEMVERMLTRNNIDTCDISDIIFTVTPDVTAMFPAAAVREMGIVDVPLLDMAAPDIDGALKMCIRAIMHVNTALENRELKHIYLGGARKLRPDLAEKKRISVAVDGPAGAGKSSVSKAVSMRLGYVYIDTGAMYRTVAVYALDKGIDIENEKDRLVSKLDDIKIDIRYSDGVQRMYLNGEDVTARIRENDASMGASAVAAIPEVRKVLVKLQQEMAAEGGVVMDGRDIGSTVLPNAELKVYLTASVDNRALRRYKEYLKKGVKCTFEGIKKDVAERDYNDMHRAVSPLKRCEDAVLLDTSGLSFDETVDRLAELIKGAEVRG